MFVPMLENEWHEQCQNIAFYHGKKNVVLSLITRFDGFGNSRVFFRISEYGKPMEYEKFDSAVSAYNTILEAITRK